MPDFEYKIILLVSIIISIIIIGRYGQKTEVSHLESNKTIQIDDLFQLVDTEIFN